MTRRIRLTTPKKVANRFGRSGFLGRMGIVLLGSGVGLFIADIVLKPTKRSIQLLAALAFLGLALVAHPFRALLFTIAIIPFPAYTSFGSTSMLMIFAVAGLSLVKAKQLNLATPFFRRDLDLAIGAFVLWMFLSLYGQREWDAYQIQIYMTGMLSAVMLYYLILQLVRTPRQLLAAVSTQQSLAIILGIIANLQALFPTRTILPPFFSFSQRVAEMEEVRAGYIRAFATFNGYELFAEFCAISIVVQYVLFRRAKSMALRAYWMMGIVIMLFALFRTGTRAGLIILLFGLFYAIVVGRPAIPRGQLIRVVFVGLALFYLTLPFTYPNVALMFERMSTIGTRDSSVQSREKVLQQAVDAIPDAFLLGHGPYQPPGTFRGGVSQNIHNLYVTLAYRMGIPGLMAFLWIAWILLRISRSTYRSPNAPSDVRELALGLHVALVMFFIDQAKIEFVRNPLNMHLAWMHFAFVTAAWRICRDPAMDRNSISLGAIERGRGA